MARIRSTNTKPERFVRSLLHRLGYRFRIHVPTLPGKPDIVLPRYRCVVLVHGCFWHRHNVCRKLTLPKTNRDFWKSKFRKNRARDRRKIKDLQELGWHVVVVWECELRDRAALAKRLIKSIRPIPG